MYRATMAPPESYSARMPLRLLKSWRKYVAAPEAVRRVRELSEKPSP